MDVPRSEKTVLLDLQYVSPGIYATYFTAGNPPQTIPVAFDTGTSDSVLPDVWFNLNASTTNQFLNDNFSIVYGSGTIGGAWVKDSLAIDGETNLENFRFAVGDKFNPLMLNKLGIIGIGLKEFETTNTFEYGISRVFPNTFETSEPKFTYDNFPISLKNAGYIDKNIFSVGYPRQATLGSILFGGVDTSKYATLVTAPIVQRAIGDWEGYTEASMMVIAIDLLNIEYHNKSEPFTLKLYPALIDTLTYDFAAPAPVIESLESLLGGKYDQNSGTLRYECHPDMTFAIRLGDSEIKIPLDQIASFDDGCFLYITQSPDDFLILGLSILSNLYTVFDADDLEISLGVYKESSTLLVLTISDGVGIPRAERVSNYSPVFTYDSLADCLIYEKAIYA